MNRAKGTRKADVTNNNLGVDIVRRMEYENLLRMAFGFSKDGQFGDMGCDPAGLAEAGFFHDGNLASVKVGTGYAFEILSAAVINKSSALEEGEHDRLDQFVEKIVSSSSVTDLSEIIAEFKETVIDRYFYFSEGKISLK